MKICPNCKTPMEDNVTFCTKCGTKFENISAEKTNSTEKTENQGTQQSNANYANTGYANPAYGSAPNYQGGPVYVMDPYDHTAEFTEKDISENKVIAMLVYLLGTMGIIIALLGSQSSPYAAFHVRQALKFTVINVLMGLVTLLLFWTFIVPIAAGIAYLVLFVVKIICFISICKGQAKEPPIIRSFGFLR